MSKFVSIHVSTVSHARQIDRGQTCLDPRWRVSNNIRLLSNSPRDPLVGSFVSLLSWLFIYRGISPRLGTYSPACLPDWEPKLIARRGMVYILVDSCLYDARPDQPKPEYPTPVVLTPSLSCNFSPISSVCLPPLPLSLSLSSSSSLSPVLAALPEPCVRCAGWKLCDWLLATYCAVQRVLAKWKKKMARGPASFFSSRAVERLAERGNSQREAEGVLRLSSRRHTDCKRTA